MHALINKYPGWGVAKKNTLKKAYKHIRAFMFFVLGFFLPSQLGKHFWPSFSYVNGVRVDYYSPTLYFTSIIVALIFVLLAPEIYKIFKSHKKIILYSAYIFFLAIILSPNPLRALLRSLSYLHIIFLAAVMFCAEKKEKKLFLYGLALSGVYQLFLAISQILKQSSIQGIWWFFGERRINIGTPGAAVIKHNGQIILRAYGTFSHPNAFAGFSLTSALVISSFLGTAFALPYFLAVFTTFSKTSIIVMGLLFAFFLITHKKTKECSICKVSKILTAVFITMLPLFWSGNPSTIIERITSIQWAIKTSVKYLFVRPFLGSFIIPGYTTKYQSLFLQPPHNIYILLLLEWGVALLAGFFILIKKYKKNIIFLSLPTAAIALTGLMDHYWLTAHQPIMLLGIIIGLSIENKTKT